MLYQKPNSILKDVRSHGRRQPGGGLPPLDFHNGTYIVDKCSKVLFFVFFFAIFRFFFRWPPGRGLIVQFFGLFFRWLSFLLEIFLPTPLSAFRGRGLYMRTFFREWETEESVYCDFARIAYVFYIYQSIRLRVIRHLQYNSLSTKLAQAELEKVKLQRNLKLKLKFRNLIWIKKRLSKDFT